MEYDGQWDTGPRGEIHIHHLRVHHRGGKDVPTNRANLAAPRDKLWHRLFGPLLPEEAALTLEEAESLRAVIAQDQTPECRERLRAFIRKRKYLWRFVHLEANQQHLNEFAEFFGRKYVVRGVALLRDAARVLWRWCGKRGRNIRMAMRHLANPEPRHKHPHHWPRRNHVIPRPAPHFA
ncbi:MAG: hypothetical protein RL681_392 [Candidatus Parcubacteria bacterium]|jgi:hypothetical protein